MKNYVFVGLPLAEAQAEAAHRGINVEMVRETAALKNKGAQGLPYVIQERWIDKYRVILVSGRRLSGGQEGIC